MNKPEWKRGYDAACAECRALDETCPKHKPKRGGEASARGNPVFSEGKVHVMAEKCSTCVFRPGNLMGLAPGRLKEMITRSIADGGGITCHKTIYGEAEQEATCRGFLDAHGDEIPALRLAKSLGVIEEV